jgi:hypothetical protein
VPISCHIMKVLAQAPRSVHHDFVFSYRGGPITTQITYAFEQACRRTGITYGRDVGCLVSPNGWTKKSLPKRT